MVVPFAASIHTCIVVKRYTDFFSKYQKICSSTLNYVLHLYVVNNFYSTVYSLHTGDYWRPTAAL